MEIQVVAFTSLGWKKAEQIFDSWKPERIFYRDQEEKQNLKQWVKEGFDKRRALIFVGAVGIGVRSIAPFVENKLYDSPVIVIDEMGNYVIPILSGHVGGANELAKRIARGCRAQAVITTATDLHHTFAVDVFALKNKLNILRKEGIVEISSKLLDGQKATIYVDGMYSKEESSELPKELVWKNPETLEAGENIDIVVSTDRQLLAKAIMPLEPREYVLGIGCRRGKLYQEIMDEIEKNGIDLEMIAYIASIDRKANEEGILELCQRNRIEYVTFSAEELKGVHGVFDSSDFVQNQVGVDNVCERAALAAAGQGAELVMNKRASNGVTLALARRRWEIIYE